MALERLEVKPAVVQWMFERTGKNPDQERAPVWTREAALWMQGKKPTLKQLLRTAQAAHIPFIYLLEDEPPPPAAVLLPDMRTIDSAEITQPSLELLETVHLCQWRQEWYRDYLCAISNRLCDFVGSVSLRDSAESVAADMRERLGVPLVLAEGSWGDGAQSLAEAAEGIGILVARNSMVNSDTKRPLNPKEFRGIALVDDRAPVVFVNEAASKGVQAFALAHGLAHLWLGETALSGGGRFTEEDQDIEQWCSRVAAELLVPQDSFRAEFDAAAALDRELVRLSKRYRVGTLVVLIRMKTLNLISPRDFQLAYDKGGRRARDSRGIGKGVHSPEQAVRHLQVKRAGKMLVQAVLPDMLDGSTSYREAFGLLGVQNMLALQQIGEIVGSPLYRNE